jgi:hypothetical protein
VELELLFEELDEELLAAAVLDTTCPWLLKVNPDADIFSPLNILRNNNF